ncbi:FGGY_C domain-containing protein [Trichonephila clavipes]|uniref:FGGY_C domain-containing protein n=1 Tax=Trichonephila clavipes TaxID=2585209 RepID=A0A8X6VCC5_TRICX|nr:FGGY_C domain-containing protein [Trichonephila clavipes]
MALVLFPAHLSCPHLDLLGFQKGQGFLDDPNTSSDIAQSVSDSGGIYFLPSACMLETAGKQNVNISTMVGLKSQTSKEHLVRAVLESLAFQVQMLLDGIEKNYGKYTGIINIEVGNGNNSFLEKLFELGYLISVSSQAPAIAPSIAFSK